MTGRTNAGSGGGSSSTFLAYLQIATDANAEITAVNLAGDTFSGMADSTGSLVLNITTPGTFTVTETDGGETSVVISDNGVIYNVEVKSFTGAFIEDGELKVQFESTVVSGSDVPTVTETTLGDENVVFVSEPSGSSVRWMTKDFVDISEYVAITFRGSRGNYATTYYWTAYGEDGSSINFAQFRDTLRTESVYIESTLYTSTRWKFGVQLYGGNSVYITDLKLE